MSDVPEVSPADTWQALNEDPRAMLIDVRTDAEWTYVGMPDLSATGKPVVPIAWQLFPSMAVNPGFVEALRAAGLTPDHRLYFLCRSGARSLASARAARAAGFPQVFNIRDGFEGPVDGLSHRRTVSGWIASGLPWRQR
ncbi:rhodanese-like domain-containing protein [Elioraea sp.]|jgi:rhodanese-related sulfurtransferase|uniref:rhodanese-like domain-containing protein n=1 Tax=Elioraea sp. TaxID=2185103 RepID=UPI003F70EF46